MPKKLKCVTPPDDCTVEQLKALLRAAGQSVSGRKAELVQRYKETIASSSRVSTPSAPAAGAGGRKKQCKTPEDCTVDQLQEMLRAATEKVDAALLATACKSVTRKPRRADLLRCVRSLHAKTPTPSPSARTPSPLADDPCRDPESCSAATLRHILKANGWDDSGRKDELVTRYKAYQMVKALQQKSKSHSRPAAGAGGRPLRRTPTPPMYDPLSGVLSPRPLSPALAPPVVPAPEAIDPKEGLKLVESSMELRLQAMREVDASVVVQVGEHHHTATVEQLEEIANVKKKLGQGAYGVVFSCCVEKPGTHACVVMRLPSGKSWTIRVALKLALNQNTDTMVKVYGAWDRFDGNNNVFREALIGRLLNRLVIAGITPHTGLLYVPLEMHHIPVISDVVTRLTTHTGRKSGGQNGVATFLEMSEMDARSFITSGINRVPPTKRSHAVRIMMLQLVQGLLAARTHLGFSHNDFHFENAMMNTVQNELWVYAMEVDGRKRRFAVPNSGMLWKIIDTGFATAEFLHSGETASIWRNAGHYLAGHAARTNDIVLRMSPDLYDVGRMLTTLSVVATDAHVLRELSRLTKMAVELSKGGELMGSLVYKVGTQYKTKLAAWRRDRRSSDQLLRRLFADMAADFEVPAGAAIRANAVFDTDAPFRAASLSGFEQRYLQMKTDGTLSYNKRTARPAFTEAGSGGRRRLRQPRMSTLAEA